MRFLFFNLSRGGRKGNGVGIVVGIFWGVLYIEDIWMILDVDSIFLMIEMKFYSKKLLYYYYCCIINKKLK